MGNFWGGLGDRLTAMDRTIKKGVQYLTDPGRFDGVKYRITTNTADATLELETL